MPGSVADAAHTSESSPVLPTTRVAVVDLHPAVREGVSSHLTRATDTIEVVASVAAPTELVNAGDVDVVLFDVAGYDEDAAAMITRLRKPGSRVLVHTAEERVVPLRRAVAAGAAGVILKRDPLLVLAAAIDEVVAGDFVCPKALAHALLGDGRVVPELSKRQVQVLRAVDEGLDRRAAARVLGISEGVVKTHLARVREKYQQHGATPGNSHHLLRLAAEDGYLR